MQRRFRTMTKSQLTSEKIRIQASDDQYEMSVTRCEYSVYQELERYPVSEKSRAPKGGRFASSCVPILGVALDRLGLLDTIQWVLELLLSL